MNKNIAKAAAAISFREEICFEITAKNVWIEESLMILNEDIMIKTTKIEKQ